MKTFTDYSQIPAAAYYLGSEDGNGEMSETLADMIAEALSPARLREAEGNYSYFDLTN